MFALTRTSKKGRHQKTIWKPQTISNCENFKKLGSCAPALLLQTLGPLISKCKANFTFIWKEDFGPQSNSPVLFLHSSGMTMSLVQKCHHTRNTTVVDHFLATSVGGCLPQSTSCGIPPDSWLCFAWQSSPECGYSCCLPFEWNFSSLTWIDFFHKYLISWDAPLYAVKDPTQQMNALERGLT